MEALPAMFENLFEHCHMGNPVFIHGIFWCSLLAITYTGTIYYKNKESKDAIAEKA